MIAAALSYAARGLYVLPIWHIVDGRCACGTDCGRNAGKHPITMHGLRDATLDEGAIRAWWTQYPQANIGIALRASGLMAFDIDTSAAEAQFNTLALPATLTQKSGSGWYHVIYRAPAFDIRGNLDAITLRGKNYIVVAPSTHASGGTYEWLNDLPIAELPPAAQNLIRRPVELGDGGIPDAANEPEWLQAISPEDRIARMRAHLQTEDGEAKGDTPGKTWNVMRTCARGYAIRSRRAVFNAAVELLDPKNRPPYGADRLTGIVDSAYEDAKNPEWGARLAPPPSENIFGEQQQTPPPHVEQIEEYGAHDLGDDPGDSTDEWIQEGLIARGVAQITAGHPKSYKTFLMEYLFVCSALGIDAFGHFKCTRTRGLLLPREDSARETLRRIYLLARGICHAHGRTFDRRELDEWLRIDSIKPFYWADDDNMRALLHTIERRQIGMVMVDSLSRTHLGDENNVKEMQPVTNRWADTCQQFGVAISVIHHFTKSGTGTLLQQLRGSGNIGAVVRHIVGVEKAKERGEPFELSFEGNLHPLPDSFQIRMRDGIDAAGQKIITFDYKAAAPAADVTRLRELKTYADIVRLLEVLLKHREHGEMKQLTGEELQRRAGMGSKTRKDALADAVRAKLVAELEPYGYGLTEVGLSTARRLFVKG